MDIAKAYDSVDHLHLVAQAEKYQYSLGILRWLLTLYTLPRLIMVNGVVTVSARASVSIVPGDSNSDVLMLLCLLSTVDQAVERFASPCHPGLYCGGIVKDIRNQTYFGMLADDLQIFTADFLKKSARARAAPPGTYA